MIKGKKKDAKKKDAKKDGKKAAGAKSEDSPGTTAVPDLQNESVNEETQAVPEAPDKEPVQPVPPIHEEPLLAQVIVKRYTCYKYSSEVKNSGLSISAVASVIQTDLTLALK